MLDWLEDEQTDAPTIPTVSRSDLERYAGDDACPFAAVAIERGEVLEASRPMVVGQEAHRIIGEAIAERVRGAALSEMIDAIVTGAQSARPDVQADVCDALKPWAARIIAETVCIAPDGCDRNPDDLIAFDEGEDLDRGGALAWDTEDPAGDPVRLVCEVDLLTAGTNRHELDLWDWKSGWMEWTSEKVARSFQFGTFYSAAVFKNFPDCHRVNVHVVMPKLSRVALASFDRHRVENIQGARLDSAIAARHAAQKAATPERWPMVGKCDGCPALHICPTADGRASSVSLDPIPEMLDVLMSLENDAHQIPAPLWEMRNDAIRLANTTGASVADDPAAAVREWVAMDERASDRMKKIKAHVKKHGAIDLGSGKTFPGSSPSFAKGAIK